MGHTFFFYFLVLLTAVDVLSSASHNNITIRQSFTHTFFNDFRGGQRETKGDSEHRTLSQLFLLHLIKHRAAGVH